MVLGLGSRTKKGRVSSSSPQVVEFDLRLHEIKPWHGFHPPRTASSVLLRWSRGDKLLGSTRSVSPKLGTAEDGAKIVFNESFRIPAAFSHDPSRTKKSTVDSERPLVFSLFETNNLKGQPLAHGSLDLEAYASFVGTKTIAIPLSFSRKVSTKGGSSHLYLTIGRHQDNRNSSSATEQRLNASVSSANSASGRTSDASSAPPLDEDTQQSLVAALLSDEEDEIASFTDDEISHGSATSQDNVSVPGRSDIRNNQSPANSHEEQYDPSNVRIPKPAISSLQASPVKAAAAAAAAVYAAKRSFLSRDTSSFAVSSYDLSSDPSSPVDDEIFTPPLLGSRSPHVVAKSPIVASFSSLASASGGGSDSAGNSKGTEAIHELQKEESQIVIGQEQTSEVGSTTGKQIDSAGVVIRDAALVEKPKRNDENREPESRSSKNCDGNSRDATTNTTNATTNSSNARTGTIPTDTAMANSILDKEGLKPRETSERNSPKVGLPNIGDATNADLTASNLAVEDNASPVDQKILPATDPGREKVPEKLRLEGGKSNEDRSQRRSLIETKSKVAPKEDSALDEAKVRVSRSPDQSREKLDKKAVEEAKKKISFAEAKVAAAETKVQQLELQAEKLKGELRDVAAVEAALYSITAEHGSSSLKVHSPARRLARVYIHACKHWGQERRASCARNTVAGLVLVARACGHDVPRLTFWWSNTVVLRETISMAFDVLPSSPGLEATSGRSMPGATTREKQLEAGHFVGVQSDTKLHGLRPGNSPAAVSEDWREPSTLAAALERVEAWIYAKVVESVWWQVLTPQMQQPVDAILSKVAQSEGVGGSSSLHERNNGKGLASSELGDDRQGNISMEIWKKAFLDAYERLCPVRALGVECGCLPLLNRMVLEECVIRLDVAMFNAILRGYDDEAPTDPISDPISDARVLPIPTSSLSFGIGAQLKNAVATLSAWLIDLLSKDADNIMIGNIPEEDEKNWMLFPFLKATADLLMVPKEMLIEKSLRTEVCPTLSLPFIGRILVSFQPDDFSSEPVTAELLEAINSEISAENQVQGETDFNGSSQRIATAPSVSYSPPQSSMVRRWIGDPTSQSRFGRSNSSVLRKGHTSDDEIDELESPIPWLLENTARLMSGGQNGLVAGHKDSGYTDGKWQEASKDAGTNCRFQLLREVWNAG